MKLPSIISRFVKAYRDTVGEPFDAPSVIRPNPEMNMIRLKKIVTPRQSHKELMTRYSGWAYICASRNGSAIAGIPLKLYATRATGEMKAGRGVKAIGKSCKRSTLHELQRRYPRHKALQLAEEVEEIVEHPMLNLLQNVNSTANRFDTLEQTSVFLDCVGNAYWYVARDSMGLPQEFWCLMSQWMFVVPDEQKAVKGYLYGVDPRTQTAFEPDDIIHFRTSNPLSQFYGLGCIEAALMAIDRYMAMDTYERSLNDNMGVPSLWIQYKTGQLEEKKRMELEQAWNNRFKGVKRAGKVAVTDNEYDIKEIGMAPREMGFSEGRRWTRLEIADAFGVPLALLDTENVNLANAKTALYQYMKFSIAPRLKRIEAKLNERLVPYYNEPRLVLAFDNCVPADDEYQLREDQAYVSMGVVTVNEVRQRKGLDPVPWGDEPMRPVLPVGATEDEDESGEGNDEEEGREGEGKLEKSHRSKGKVGTGEVLPLTRNQKRMAKAVGSVFAMQESAALKWVSDHALLFGHKSNEKAAVPERIWGDEWDGVMSKMTVEPVRVEFEGGMRNALRKLRKDKKCYIKAKPKIDLADDQNWVNRPEMGGYVRSHTMKFAKAVNKRTHDELRKLLSDGIDNELPLSDIRSGIEDLFNGYEDYRVDRIARTETARAFVGGERQAYRDSGVVEKLVWLASADACEFCLSINGKTVSVNSDFFKQGSQIMLADGRTMDLDYTDVEGPPLHCHCRCDIVPQIIEQGE